MRIKTMFKNLGLATAFLGLCSISNEAQAQCDFNLNVSSMEATTFGEASGYIFVKPEGGVGPYHFKLTNSKGEVIHDANSNWGPTLRGDSYTFDVTDLATGCTESGSADINIPNIDDIHIISTSTTSNSSCGANDGSLTVKVTKDFINSNAGYFYINAKSEMGEVYSSQMSGAESVFPGDTLENVITGLPAGKYVLNITDGYSMAYPFVEQTFTIDGEQCAPVNSSLSISGTPMGATQCFEAYNGNLYSSVSNGSGDYKYVLFDALGNVMYKYVNYYPQDLAPGDYTLRVVDQSNGAFADHSFNIAADCPCEGSGIEMEITDVVDCMDPYGTATVTLNTIPEATFMDLRGDNGYLNGMSFGIYSDLEAANYTIDIIDAMNECTVTNYFSVYDERKPLTMTSSHTPVTDCSTDNGTFTAIITSEDPYSLTLQGVPDTDGDDVFENLSLGFYNAIAITPNNCYAQTTIEITDERNNISLSSAVSDLTDCASDNGSISTTVTSANPYTLTWQTGMTIYTDSDQDGAQGGLPAGTYTVLAEDASNCSASEVVTIADARNNISLASTTTDVTDCVNDNGSITTTVTSANAYTLTWEHADGTVYTDSDQDGNQGGLPAGAYTIVAADANNCSATGIASIGLDQNNISLMSTSTDVTDCSSDNGSITTTVTSNDAYTLTWEHADGTIYTDSDQDGIQGSLPAGAYTVLAVDANNCSGSGIASIGDARNNISLFSTSTDVTDCQSPNGTISTSVSSSNAYTLTWEHTDGTVYTDTDQDNFQGGLPIGNYSIMAVDAYNCSATESIEILEDCPPVCTLSTSVTKRNTSSRRRPNGEVYIIVNGGSGDYSYDWTLADGSTVSGGSSMTGLSEGTYTIDIADNVTGCTISVSETIIKVKKNQRRVGAFDDASEVEEIVEEREAIFLPYPNPARDNFKIDYQGNEEDAAVIYIINAMGMIVDQFEINADEQTIEISTENYAAGMYIINLNVNGQNQMQETVIINK